MSVFWYTEWIMDNKKLPAKILFIFIPLGLVLWLLFFGFRIIPCVNKYNEVAIPEFLYNKQIILEKNSASVNKSTSIFCKWSGGPKTNEKIVFKEYVIRNKIREGSYIAEIQKGKKFELIKIVEETSIGIGDISSGGPIYYLVLKDEYDKNYILFTSALDYNSVGYYENETREGYLSWQLIKDFYQ